MVIAGFAIFLSSLSSANVAVPYTIGVAFDLLPAVLFLHVFLAFPSGRLERPAERALVGAGYVTAFGAQLVGMALGGFGPDNLLDGRVGARRGVLAAARSSSSPSAPSAWPASACWSCAGGRAGRPARRCDRAAGRRVRARAGHDRLPVPLGRVRPGPGEPAFETIRRTHAVRHRPRAGRVPRRVAQRAPRPLGGRRSRRRAARRSRRPQRCATPWRARLRDPSLTLVYWLEEFESWADVDGKPIELPARGRQADDHADRARRDPRRGARPRSGAGRRARPAASRRRRGGDRRSRTRGCRSSCARAWTSCGARARGSSRPPTRSAAGWSATCTTAPSSGWSSVALQLRLAQGRISDDPAVAEQLLTTASDELALSRAAARRRGARARRRDRRHPHAARPERRGPAGGARDPGARTPRSAS